MASVTTAEAVVAVSGVETEVEEGTQGKVRIRVIRHDLSVVREDGDGRALHLVAPTGIHPASENASVVVADARSASILTSSLTGQCSRIPWQQSWAR